MHSARSRDVFHLPQLQDSDVVSWESRVVETSRGALTLTWPLLHASGAARIARLVRQAGDALRKRPVKDIVTAIDAAVAHMRADADGWNTLTCDVAAVTGYSEPMAHHVMNRMADDWGAPALLQLIDDELGGCAVLDGFAVTHGMRNGARVHAVGPKLSFHIFSGNVPGVSITSIVRALLVKAPVFGKAASGEPLLAAAFAQSLYDVDEDIGNALAITYWQGGTQDIEAAVLTEADAVIHYGGGDAIADVRRRMPAHARLLEHGPRISFGVIARDALITHDDAERVAADVAYATSIFDQQGCVSPHTVFVETGGSVGPRDFAAMVEKALRAMQAELPRGVLTAGDVTAIRALRDTAEFRGIGGADVDVLGPGDLSATVIYDGTAGLTASCLNRTLFVHPVDSIGDVVGLIQPYASVLQSAAIAASAATARNIATLLATAGVTRITTFRAMPWPNPSWHHDGRGPLTELVRFIDFEGADTSV